MPHHPEGVILQTSSDILNDFMLTHLYLFVGMVICNFHSSLQKSRREIVIRFFALTLNFVPSTSTSYAYVSTINGLFTSCVTSNNASPSIFTRRSPPRKTGGYSNFVPGVQPYVRTILELHFNALPRRYGNSRHLSRPLPMSSMDRKNR